MRLFNFLSPPPESHTGIRTEGHKMPDSDYLPTHALPLQASSDTPQLPSPTFQSGVFSYESRYTLLSGTHKTSHSFFLHRQGLLI